MCDLDEEVGMLFLEEKPITKQDLKAAIRRQTIANKFVPVAGGSAFKNKGVQYLVDAVVDYLPSPLDIAPAKGQNPDTGEPMQATADDNARFCSLAFKLWSDPFVGKLVFFRVYAGKLSKGDTVYNPRTNKRERISRLIQIQADKREDIDTCYSGDIAAIVGIKNITTGEGGLDEAKTADARARNKNGSTPMLLASQNIGRGGSGSADAKAQQKGGSPDAAKLAKCSASFDKSCTKAKTANDCSAHSEPCATTEASADTCVEFATDTKVELGKASAVACAPSGEVSESRSDDSTRTGTSG
jgi:hypothetical protein